MPHGPGYDGYVRGRLLLILLYSERELCTKFPVYPRPVAGDENKWKKPHRKDGAVSREEYTGQHSSALPSRKQAAAGRSRGDRHRRQYSMSDI